MAEESDSQIVMRNVPVPHTRILSIDLLRSLAVLLMIIFHTAFDLQIFYEWNIDVFHGIWNVVRIITASLFLGLAGISTHFTRHPYKRASTVALAAAAVTLATFLWDPETYIRFGILHCIAVSVFALPLFKTMRLGNIFLGIIILIIGNAISGHILQTSLLIPFGFVPPLFATLDYYPLLPWFGVTLMGYGLGFRWNLNAPTHGAAPTCNAPTHGTAPTHGAAPTHGTAPTEGCGWCGMMNILAFPGRHALVLYLVHQPMILAVLHITL